MPKDRCSNCVAYDFECTYAEATKVGLASSVYDQSGTHQRVHHSRNLNCPNGELLIVACCSSYRTSCE